jgi:hypothetical protein
MIVASPFAFSEGRSMLPIQDGVLSELGTSEKLMTGHEMSTFS